MQIFLDKQRWKEVFEGYEIVDVALRTNKIVQFALRKKFSYDQASRMLDSEIPSRIVTVFLDRNQGENCGFQELEGMVMPLIGVSRAPFIRPSGLLVSFDTDGSVWPHGGGNGPIEFIDPGQRPSTNRLKCIDGFTYSVGMHHKIYKRTQVGVWEKVKGFPELEKKEEVFKAAGFSDLDQFAPNDMYAVGGLGDVWHFDGQQWKQMGFPSNEQLATVTCAGDGKVYITGEAGNLWVGEKSTWKLVYKGSSNILWNDALWFQDKLWLASDYHLRVWDGKEMQAPVGDDGDSVPISGHMDVYDGMLVVASLEFVMLYDGHTWRRIVAPYLD